MTGNRPQWVAVSWLVYALENNAGARCSSGTKSQQQLLLLAKEGAKLDFDGAAQHWLQLLAAGHGRTLRQFQCNYHIIIEVALLL
jgi:hypothetical protein